MSSAGKVRAGSLGKTNHQVRKESNVYAFVHGLGYPLSPEQVKTLNRDATSASEKSNQQSAMVPLQL